MNSTLVYWVSVLGQFFGLSTCLILGTKLGAKLWPNVFASLSWMLHLSKHLGMILGLIFCSVLGYAAHDLRDYYTTTTLTDIAVLAKHNDYNFRLQTDFGQAFETTFCQDGPPPDFLPNERIKVLVYKQKRDCKSLNGKSLGYIMYSNPDGSKTKFLQETASE